MKGNEMSDKKSIPIALQLFSVRKDCEQDLSGTLKAVSEMGYEGVEFAGYYDYRAEDIKKMLDDNGLRIAGSHTKHRALFSDELEETLEFNRILCNKYVIVPWLPEEYRDSVDAWKKTSDLFNELAEKTAPFGISTGYHNHNVEFEEKDGETPMEIFCSHTNNNVIIQFDTGNALQAGFDVSPLIEKYPGRSITIHLKEFSSENDKAIPGEGDVPWQKIFTLCETVGDTQWYIIEQESYAHPPLECVTKSLENIRSMLKQ